MDTTLMAGLPAKGVAAAVAAVAAAAAVGFATRSDTATDRACPTPAARTVRATQPTVLHVAGVPVRNGAVTVPVPCAPGQGRRCFLTLAVTR